MEHPTIKSVRSLRKALGETQEQFASRFKATVRTISRWESERPASGAVLLALAQVAAASGHATEAETFKDAFAKENHISGFGNDMITRRLWREANHVTEPLNEEELTFVAIQLCLFRNREHFPNWIDRERDDLAAVQTLEKRLEAGEQICTDAEVTRDVIVWARNQLAPSAVMALRRLTHEDMRESGRAYGESRQKVERENPELYRQHLSELGLTPETAPARKPPIVSFEVDGERISLRRDEHQQTENLPKAKKSSKKRPAGKPDK